jgi:hypothetical protein
LYQGEAIDRLKEATNEMAINRSGGNDRKHQQALNMVAINRGNISNPGLRETLFSGLRAR